MRGRLTLVALMLTLTLAFALRIWSISWGMPYVLHGDEPKYLPRAVTMLETGNLNPHYFENPPLFTYLLLLELIPFVPLAQRFGVLPMDTPGRLLYLNPEPFYLVARLNNVLLGTATVILTCLIARHVFGNKANKAVLLSAALMAVSFLHVRDSHYAVTDVPATFLLTAAAYFSSRVLSKGRVADYLLGGVFLGLAVATKYNTGIGIAALLAAHLMRFDGWRRIRLPRTHLPLALAGLAALAAFVLANPFAVLDSGTFIRGFSDQYRWTRDTLTTQGTHIGLVVLGALWTGFGPALIFGAVGIALGIRGRHRTILFVASFPLAYLVFFLLDSSVFYARFAIPMLPFLSILAAWAATNGVDMLSHRFSARLGNLAAVFAVVTMVVPPLVLDVRHDALLMSDDTRVLLGRWVDANIPPGSMIGVEGYTLLDSEGRHMDPTRVSYEILAFPTLAQHSARDYEQADYNYLIASSYVFDRYPPTEDFAEARKTYAEIASRFRLIASFYPTADDRGLPFRMDEEITPFYTVLDRIHPGPVIKVYQVTRTVRHDVQWVDASVPSAMSREEEVSVPVAVRNVGDITWWTDGMNPVRVGYHWVDTATGDTQTPDRRGLLPKRVRPGQKVTSMLELVAPKVPGMYLLRLDMVQENYAWFSDEGCETRDLYIEVR